VEVRSRELIMVEPTSFMTAVQKALKPGTRTLKDGDFGGDVAWMQDKMGQPPTGRYGKSTRQAVEDYQQELNLPVTGVCDYVTWAALGAVGKWNWPLELGQHFGPGDCDRCIVEKKKQRAGSHLGRLQRKLGVPETGVYDRATEVAVMRWQRSHRMPTTGRIDLETWVQMVSR
jgi:peptidoglycan hydrolase-like protein with peptidoglycan-binding domain